MKARLANHAVLIAQAQSRRSRKSLAIDGDASRLNAPSNQTGAPGLARLPKNRR
jgi:hypothetical protein